MQVRRGENWRFWIPVVLLVLFASYPICKLVKGHVDPAVSSPNYQFTKNIMARRGSIFSSSGRSCPFVKSVSIWEYNLDPVSLTNSLAVGRKKRITRDDVIKTIAGALNLDYAKVVEMAEAKPRPGYRNQFLARSSDRDSYRTLADSSRVCGVAIHDMQERVYHNGRRLSHVLGSVNAEGVGSCGIEQRFNSELSGMPGTIQGMRDARGRELYDKRQVSVESKPGSDIFLTIDGDLQIKTENCLEWGMREFGAGSGWCIVMDSQTGAVLAMASRPSFDPKAFGKAPDSAKMNRAIAYNYEPGSVMKVITAASAIDAGFITPNRVYTTNRDDKRYYKLPGDGSHVWEPTMTIKDAIVHSSNIVIGKLGCDFGPLRLYDYMRKFGFGSKTGIELPGEQYGIVNDPRKVMWDKASQSRAAIGQSVAVTGIQLINAYQAIANDGVRMRPYIVERIEDYNGEETYRHHPTVLSRPISAKTARTMREVMLDVASPRGTARRAAIPGYSVAGKTGTAQKTAPDGRGYLDGLYRASFCGIVPASEPRLVVLVTLDFEQRTKFHQGGNSAGPVFQCVAFWALRHMMVQPDRPDELLELDDKYDEFVRTMEERAGLALHLPSQD